MTIDWYDLTQKYNTKNHTNYESEREMIKDIYAAERSLNRTGDELRISAGALRIRMQELGLKTVKKGWIKQTPILNKIICHQKNHFQSMTRKQIAEEIGCSRNQVKNIFDRYGYKFKRVRKRK